MSEKKVKHALIGKVVSDSRDKSIKVLVERKVKHPIYKKIIKRSTKIHVHDEHNQSQLGDIVKVLATAPLSKTKHWRLLEVVERSVKVD